MVKLHVGCGQRILQGWINADMRPSDSTVVRMDAAGLWPFSDGQLDYVFSEHLLEHLTFDGGLSFLHEAHRCLKAGGRMRIATYDVGFLLDIVGEWDHKPQCREFVQKHFVACKGGIHPVMVVNQLFREWGQFLWSPPLLHNAITNIAKFSSAYQCCVGTSVDSNLSDLEQKGQGIETMVFETVR